MYNMIIRRGGAALRDIVISGELNIWSMLLRLIAVTMGGLIGFERETKAARGGLPHLYAGGSGRYHNHALSQYLQHYGGRTVVRP